MILNIILTFLFIATAALDYFVEKEKHKKAHLILTIVVVVFGSIAIWLGSTLQNRDAAETHTKFTVIKGQYDTLKISYDTLISQNNQLLNENKKTTALLTPFIILAKTIYPNAEEQVALRYLTKRLGTVEQKVEDMQPKLQLIDSETKIQKLANGKIETILIFRSKTPVDLSSVYINITFDKPISNIMPHVGGGASTISSGEAWGINKDSKGFTYRTDHLIPSNYVHVKIESNDSLKIVTCKLHP